MSLATLRSLCKDCVNQGISKLTVILDNNSTHKQKMQSQLQAQLSELGIKEKISVEFIYTPPYSPDFNLVEYIIHLLRLKLLHHLPVGMTIEQIREKLEKYFQFSQLQTPEQIQNTIGYICALAR